ncbi:MAG: hypothetical protein R2692_01485 [Microbacterium sp.]
MCPECAAIGHAKRDARTDLTGKRALLTGGRAKIGMYIALRLLRDGAHDDHDPLPRDAVRRSRRCPTRATGSPPPQDRRHRPARDPAQVIELADAVASDSPSTFSSTTPRRRCAARPGAYKPLVDASVRAVARHGPLPELLTFDAARRRASSRSRSRCRATRSSPRRRATPATLTAEAMAAGSSSLERLAAGTAIDAGVPTRTTSTAGRSTSTRSSR